MFQRQITLFDHKRNDDIWEELKVEPVDEKLRRHKSNWLHVTWMNSNRMPNITLNYRPNGRRRIGIPLKGPLDEAKAGLLRPKPWRMMITVKWDGTITADLHTRICKQAVLVRQSYDSQQLESDSKQGTSEYKCTAPPLQNLLAINATYRQKCPCA